MNFELELESERVVPGESITGTVDVLEGGRSRALTLTVRFHERTRDYSATPYSSSGTVHEGDLHSGQTLPFSFTLPAGAPPSAESEHSQLAWELELRSNEPGRDTIVRLQLEVVPGSGDEDEVSGFSAHQP